MIVRPRIFLGFALLLAFSAHPAMAADQPLRHVIDTDVGARLQKEKITPAAQADDATFLRRVFLDLVGVIPTHDEAKAFLQDTATDRRATLIDRLLADPRFAQNQAQIWDLWLFGRNPRGDDNLRKRDGFRKWLATQFADNVPYDRWVRTLLQAETEGTEIYYAQFRNQPEDAAVAVSRIFMGTQLQCARCHDHPFERWTQKDFYGLAGFFVRLVVVDTGGGEGKRKYMIAEKSTGEVLFTGSVKEQRPGQKGEPVRPRFLGGADLEEPPVPKDFKEPVFKGKEAPPAPLFSRKEKLAAWLASADNPYFARAVANRVWAQFLGRGLVHPVDDLTEKNESSHAALLDALTQELTGHSFDLKHLIRELVNSAAYQRGPVHETKNALPAFFERARVRPLSAEELQASIKLAGGYDAAIAKVQGEHMEYFTRYFGEPTNGQGEFQASLGEHLFLNNSEQLRRMIQPRPGNLGDTILKSTAPWEERVERLFLTVLSRMPRSEERERFVQYLSAEPKEANARVEEAIWTLVACAEFRFSR